ncbi:MAG: CDP-glycerol glycerophosphotransferase family protein [Blautia sp.]|nr:CDP-glycerol glycerophosphotransferase family protein [Blautia sp.]
MGSLQKKVKSGLLIPARFVFDHSSFLKYHVVRAANVYKAGKYKKEYARKYRTDPKLILFVSYWGKQYSCNPRALFEELLRDPRYREYKKVWAFEEPEGYGWLAGCPRTKVVRYRSRDFYRYCAKAGIWIANCRMPDEVIPKKDQVYVQAWHGTPLKKLGFDIGRFKGRTYEQKEHEYQYRYDAGRITWFLSPSDFYREKITSAFALRSIGKENCFLEGGYPRNDFLFRYSDKEAREIREKLGIPDNKRVILYTPTWREDDHQGYRYKLAVHFEKWRECLGEDTVILYRSHYMVANYIDLSRFSGFVYNVSDYDDIRDLYVISDLLVTDYSSVFFDYANLHRPILFYMYDHDHYREEMRGFYIDEKELPGPIVQTEEELLKLLLQYDGSGYEEIYEAFNRKFNPYQDGQGSAVVWQRLLEDGQGY